MTLRQFMMRAVANAVNSGLPRSTYAHKLDAWSKWRRRSGDI